MIQRCFIEYSDIMNVCNNIDFNSKRNRKIVFDDMIADINTIYP